jgi:hypothetical protein
MENKEIRVVFRQVVNILICAAIAGFAVNLVHPKGYDWKRLSALRQGKHI